MNRYFWRRTATLGLTALVLTSVGCSIFPEAMQPHNLQKLNRGPAPTTDPFFSVQDRSATTSELSAEGTDAEAAVEAETAANPSG